MILDVKKRRPIASLASAILLASLALTRVSRADVPPPGTHGAPKRWQIGVTVTNFSPFAFDGPIVGLTPDKRGGVWFGLGRTLEHIDATGRMQNYEVSREPLWSKRARWDGRFQRSLADSDSCGTQRFSRCPFDRF